MYKLQFDYKQQHRCQATIHIHNRRSTTMEKLVAKSRPEEDFYIPVYQNTLRYST